MLIIAGICSICCDNLDCTVDDISVVHCGHLFHSHCLERWVNTCKKTPTCPHCRSTINKRQTVPRLYPDLPKDGATQQVESATATRDLRAAMSKQEKLEQQLKAAQKAVKVANESKENFEAELNHAEVKISIQNDQMKQMKIEVSAFKREVAEVRSLKKRLKMLETENNQYGEMEKVLNGGLQVVVSVW